MKYKKRLSEFGFIVLIWFTMVIVFDFVYSILGGERGEMYAFCVVSWAGILTLLGLGMIDEKPTNEPF